MAAVKASTRRARPRVSGTLARPLTRVSAPAMIETASGAAADDDAATAAATPAKAAKAKAKAKAKGTAAKVRDLKPKALVQRIYNTIDSELTKLERHKGASSQDRERASRALSQMVSSLEKAVDMQREITKSKSSPSTVKDKEALRHAEDLRREIASRLERLTRERGSAKRAQ